MMFLPVFYPSMTNETGRKKELSAQMREKKSENKKVYNFEIID